MSKPLVSISCLTYNHVNYIKDTIEGFLMQKTNFDFEILIHDDASTDGTTEIIKEYANNYPEIIKPLYETENQWQKGRRGSVVFNFPRAQGKYIALCEGDDYWTDPYKLQKQVDFLEENEEVVICGTRVHRLVNNHLIKNNDSNEKIVYYNHSDLLINNPIRTLTSIFRKTSIPKYISKCKHVDRCLWLYLTANKQKIAILPDITSVYRVHQNGIYSGIDVVQRKKNSIHDRLLLIENSKNKKYCRFFIKYYFTEIFKGIIKIILRRPDVNFSLIALYQTSILKILKRNC